MYRWRRLTPEQRVELLRYRQLLKRPWHRPPHFGGGSIHYLLTAACYEHRPHIGLSPERMAEFSASLLDVLPNVPAAWCVLPNHYHALIRADDLKAVVQSLAKLHGRTSFAWNQKEETRGRKIFHGVSDRRMRNESHYWASVNYVHHNPVRHGYVKKWTDWPSSSAVGYLEEMGKENAEMIWKTHPLDEYGRGWDDPEF